MNNVVQIHPRTGQALIGCGSCHTARIVADVAELDVTSSGTTSARCGRCGGQMHIVERWKAPPRRNLLELARSFPTLEHVPEHFFAERDLLGTGNAVLGFADSIENPAGGEMFGGEAFARWAAETGGGGQRDAALFVLAVWNTSDDWTECGLERHGSGRFNMHGALGNWDEAHRAAFVAWASNPWWL